MTKTNYQKIIRKLDSLRKHSQYLKRLRDKVSSFEDYSSDFEIIGSTERYLQLCAQSIISIVHLIIIDMDMNKPEDNYEAISIIFNKGIVFEEMADNLIKIVGLRNALVHEYEDIDNKKIYDVLVNRLEAMDEFENIIRKYIG